MELHHLRSFLAVFEERHLSRAADRLHLSQPAVSSHVRALEDELGLTLFERTPRGMLPTAAAEALLPGVRRSLDAVAALKRQAQDLRGEVIGAVRIGLNTDAGYLRLVELQAALRHTHPRLSIEFLAGTTGSNLPKLRAGRLDASFLSGALDDPLFTSQVLREEEMAIAVPVALLAEAGSADLAALAELPWIHSSPDRVQHAAMCQLFAPLGRMPACVMVANQKDAVLAMVDAGVGLAITRRLDIERAAARGGLAALAFPGEAPPSVSLRFACLRARADEPMLRALRSAVATLWADAAEPAPG